MDFTKSDNNFDHYMQFLSTHLGKGHTLLCLAQNTGVYKISFKMFLWCGIRSIGDYRSGHRPLTDSR